MDIFRIPHPTPNGTPSQAQILVDKIVGAFRALPDGRKPGNHRKYSMFDAACSAFSVFFTQCPSFLSFQKILSRTTGRNNLQSLFGVFNTDIDMADVKPLEQKVSTHHPPWA